MKTIWKIEIIPRKEYHAAINNIKTIFYTIQL